MRVLVAPDRFGGTLPAPEVAAAVREGWARAAPTDDVTVCPLSDGGPGFVAALHATLGGELLSVTVRGPLGDDVPGVVLLVRDAAGGPTAYVEAAHVTGPDLVPAARADPVRTSSAGVGGLLRVARESGARRVVVGLGAGTTYDAGAGMLAALGVGAGMQGPLLSGAAALGEVTAEDLAGLAELRTRWSGVDLVAACDLDLPLLGLHGLSATAAVRGELPGAAAQTMERAVAHLAHTAVGVLGPDAVRPDLLATARRTTPAARLTSLPGAGAGGGLGFALALLGARLRPGPAVVADAVGLPALVGDAEVVVTGTGRLDPMVLHGSVVAVVAERALPAAVPTVVLAGEVLVGRRELAAAGVAAAYPVRGTTADDAAWAADPASALARRAERVARTWSH